MITGHVFGRRVYVPVTIRVPNQPNPEIEFVLDTGFIGFLTLPPAAVSAIGLPYHHSIPANLADGSSILVDVHSATILWHGQERRVEVLAMGQQPLLGTSLLDGNDVIIRFSDGSPVTIAPFA